MPNEKNHLYSIDDETKDRKSVTKKKDQQQFSRFSTALATSVNNASIRSVSPALQVETQVQIGIPYDDTKGSTAINQVIDFATYGSQYTFFKITDDTAFTFTGLPTGRAIEFTIDILVDQVAGVAITFPSVTNPPVLAGNNGDRYVLTFVGVLRSDLTGQVPPVSTYTFLTGATASSIAYPIIWPRVDQTPAPAATVTIDLSLTTGNANVVTFPAGNIDLAFSNPPGGLFAEETHVLFIQDGVGSRTFGSVPASIKNGGLMNGLLDATAGSQTLFKFVTHDNGVTFHAVLIDLTTSVPTTVPVGVSLNDHLEWNGLSWVSQQFFEFNDIGPWPDDGFNRFPNDTIGLAWRNQANTGNVEVKVDPIFNYFDITNSAEATVGITLRAQHAIDPDNVLTIAQTPTASGIAFISTSSTELWLEIGAFQKIRLIGQDLIQLFDDVDNIAFFRTNPNVVNLGEINAIVFEFFGASSSFTGRSISRYSGGLHYDIEDVNQIHSFRVGGATPSNAVDITQAELLVYSPLDIIPSDDGDQNIGSASASWNDINADRIIFRHNNGVVADFPSIGRTSNALILNSPENNATEFQINGIKEYSMTNLGFIIENLNAIIFLDSLDNQDVQIALGSGGALLINTNDTNGSVFIDQKAIIPTLALRGNNNADNLLAHQILFLGLSDTMVQREYASIKVKQLDTQFGNEMTEMRFALQEAGTFDTAYLSLNSLFERVFIFKDLSMSFMDIINMGGGTINLLSEDVAPDLATDFIMSYDASADALKKVKMTTLPFSPGGSTGAHIVKNVDDTVINSTALIADTELKFVAMPNQVYFLELNANFESDGASDMKFGLKIPTGASYKVADSNFVSSAWSSFTFSSDGETIFFDGGSGTRQSNSYYVLEAGSVGGTVTISFAQNLAQPVNTKLLRGSLLRIFEGGIGGLPPDQVPLPPTPIILVPLKGYAIKTTGLTNTTPVLRSMGGTASGQFGVPAMGAGKMKLIRTTIWDYASAAVGNVALATYVNTPSAQLGDVMVGDSAAPITHVRDGLDRAFVKDDIIGWQYTRSNSSGTMGITSWCEVEYEATEFWMYSANFNTVKETNRYGAILLNSVHESNSGPNGIIRAAHQTSLGRDGLIKDLVYYGTIEDGIGLATCSIEVNGVAAFTSPDMPDSGQAIHRFDNVNILISEFDLVNIRFQARDRIGAGAIGLFGVRVVLI